MYGAHMSTITRTQSEPLLRIETASRIFRMGEVEVPAVVDVNLTIEQGEFLAILGPSGSGKSSLLNLIGGIDRPNSGRLWYRNSELTAMSEQALTNYRRDAVGFIFQFYNLVPTLTAYENVQVATELIEDPLNPAEALTLVDLQDRADHFPAQLSGGEQQRVAIARALAKKPDLLLADEPTGALDLKTAKQVLAILQRLNAEQALTIILITHNAAITKIARKVVRLVSGQITESHINEQPIAAEKISW